MQNNRGFHTQFLLYKCASVWYTYGIRLETDAEATMGGETYELDGLDFLNPASTAAVLFQTFMGAACVFTHEGGAY